MTFAEIEPYIDYVLGHFKHICAFFFIGTGLWKLLRKNKILQESEELIAKIPKEDDWVIDLVKFIDKWNLFFAIPAIIVGCCILLTINSETKPEYFDIYRYIGWCVFYSFIIMISMPVYYSVGRFASLGRLNLYKSEIKLWYDLQNYKAIDEWIDIDKYMDAKEIIKGFKFYKLFVLTIIVGKFIFYSGIIILCFL